MSPSRIQTRGVKLQPPLYEKIDNVPPHLYPLAMKTEGYISGQHVVPLKIKENTSFRRKQSGNQIKNTLYFGQNLNRGISTISCSCCLTKVQKKGPRKRQNRSVKKASLMFIRAGGLLSLKVNSFIEKERTFARRIVP